MSGDYSKMKNAELEAILRTRQLPLGGKKVEMVARLVEDDKNAATIPEPPSAAVVPAPAAADAEAATTTPAAAAIAAGGTATRAPNPVDVPNQAPAIDPSATADLSVSKDTTTSAAEPLAAPEDAAAAADATAPEAAAEAAPAVDFSSNLAPTDVDAEIAKRKARAAKFGIKEDDNDAVKALERAKRFGTGMVGEAAAGEAVAAGGSMGMSRLDEALPERRERKRARAPAGDALEDEGLKRRRGSAGASAIRGRKDGARRTQGGRVEKAGWMSEADRAAAEKRKSRFATAS